MVYELTRTFPKEEAFGLTSQMRRAAVSVPSNIAEGFCRNTQKDKVQFYLVARGSLAELHTQLILCQDIAYLDQWGFQRAEELIIVSQKILSGLIKTAESYQ